MQLKNTLFHTFTYSMSFQKKIILSGFASKFFSKQAKPNHNEEISVLLRWISRRKKNETLQNPQMGRERKEPFLCRIRRRMEEAQLTLEARLNPQAGFLFTGLQTQVLPSPGLIQIFYQKHSQVTTSPLGKKQEKHCTLSKNVPQVYFLIKIIIVK